MKRNFDPSDSSPCPTPFNLAAYVLAHAERDPEKPALEIIGGASHQSWSFAALHAKVTTLAAALLARGLHPGDKVVLRLRNSLDFPVAYLGCIWAGIIPVPTSTQLTTRELAFITQSLCPKALICDAPNIPTERDETGQTRPALLSCPVVMISDLSHDLSAGTASRSQQVTQQIAQTQGPHMGDSNRLAYIIFTSGTSGSARGVMHAHRAIWARRMMYEGWYGLSQRDRVLHAGAMNWSYTLGTGLLDPWSQGATALIPDSGVEPARLPALIREHNASIFAAVPGIYRKILKSEPPPMPSLRHGLSAGERLSPQLRRLWQDHTQTDIHEAFGMSECSTFISGNPRRPAVPGSCGRTQPGRRVAVLDHAQRNVPAGTSGFLAIARSDPGLMLGYLDAQLPKGEWFVTGDLVSMSADGDITYLGRADDMMNAGGYRVSPLEVETAFHGFAGIGEVAAVAVDLKQDVQGIALYYTCDRALSDATLRRHAQKFLARYKQPRLYIRIAAMPKGTNGKLNRAALRARPLS